MKIFNKICKILFYTLLAGIIVTTISSATLYYRVVVRQKPLILQSLHFERTIAQATIIDVDIAELSFSTDADKRLVLMSTGFIVRYNQKLVLNIDHLQVRAELEKLLSSLSIQIDLNIDKVQFFSKNIPVSVDSKLERSFSWNKALKTIHSILNKLSTHKLFFIGNININNAIISHHNMIYELNFTSSLNQNNQLTGIFTIKNPDMVSTVNLTIDNTKPCIDTKLKFNYFPSTLLASFIPEKYHNKIIGNAEKGLMISGEINYNIDNINGKNILDIALKNLSPVESKNALPYSMSLFKLNIFIDSKLRSVVINNFLFKLINNTKLQVNGEINKLFNLLNDSYKVNAAILAENIQINSLKNLWPEEIMPPARNWLIGSIKNGVVEKASCTINITNTNHISPTDIVSNLEFSNVDLKYDNDFDQINNISGHAKFDTHSAKINIQSAKLLSSDITNGLVEIIYDDPDLPLVITADTKGYGKDYLNFIGQENVRKIEASGLNLSAINSSLSSKIYVKILLQQDISLANTILNINAELKNTSVNFLNKVKVTEGNFQLFIDNKTVKLSGPAKINEQSGNINWTSYISNTDDLVFDHQLIVNLVLNTQSSFEEIVDHNFLITDGYAKMKLQYTSFPKYENFSSSIDFTNAKFTVPDINLVKDDNKACTFNLEMTTNEDKTWKTTKLELISENSINITAQAKFTAKFAQVIFFNSNVKFYNNIFNIKYQNLDNKIKFSLSGDKMNLKKTRLFGYFKHDNTSSKQAVTEINFNVKRILMSNDVIFYDVIGKFNCELHACTSGTLKLDMEEETRAVLSLTKENNQPKLLLKTDNAASFLRAFDVYQNIKGGELIVTVTKVNKQHAQLEPVYSGEIELTKFTATKTPILAKLISFSSFRGILSILQSYTSIPFQKMHGQFIIANDIIMINQTYISGDFLALSVAGTIDMNQKYLNLYGQVVPPVYGFNSILSILPFIGHDIPGSKGRRGLIAGNYTIKGPLDKAKVFVDPLSLFLPGLLDSSILSILIP